MRTDASGSWGCGAVWASHWFCWAWSAPWAPLPIAPKELLPVVLAAAVWGESWSGASLLLECDNTVVVAAVRSGSSRDAALMPLLRTLQFFAAHFGFAWRARHIPGEQNTLADGLSRNVSPATLRTSFPQLAAAPTPIPGALLELVTPPRLPWNKPRWRELFHDTLRKVSRTPREDPTPPDSAGSNVFASS